MQHYKDHSGLFWQAFVVLDSHGRNLEEFLHHESSPYPPALSGGSLNYCTRSDLLVYIMESCTRSAISVEKELAAPDILDFIVIDGGVLIHSVPGSNVQGWSFDSYFYKFFCPRVR